MQFLTIAYGDPAAYDRTAPEIRNAAHDHDAWMAANGKIVAGGMAGAPVQVRNHNAAGIETSAGPYLRTELPVAGYAILEAASLEEAIELAAKSPCAITEGVIEVWPVVHAPA
ncbi:YciI family protein [Microlunatus sp. GCM10028923]|uniref:YciI family protein n=1 Tax=Microlunatus sp. GCM10028923 TaxID=3273400 RepID=UPI003607F8F4